MVTLMTCGHRMRGLNQRRELQHTMVIQDHIVIVTNG